MHWNSHSVHLLFTLDDDYHSSFDFDLNKPVFITKYLTWAVLEY